MRFEHELFLSQARPCEFEASAQPEIGWATVIRLVAVQNDPECLRLMVRYLPGRILDGRFNGAKETCGVVWNGRSYVDAGFAGKESVTEQSILQNIGKLLDRNSLVQQQV